MSNSSDKLSIPRALVKGVAILGGLYLSLICLMAAIGAITGNGWARFLGSLVVLIVVPAVIADRVIPDDSEAAAGIPTDVFALTWLGFPVVFAVALGSLTQKMLVTEGDRLAQSGWSIWARTAYLLGSVEPAEGPAPATDGSAAASASATASTAQSTSASASVSSSGSAPPPPPKKSGDEMSDTDIFKTYAPAVVSIKIKGAGGGFVGGGTGFLIDKKGRIVTNHHVIEAAKSSGAEILFKEGARYDKIWVLEDDAAVDLALLEVDLDDPKEGDAPATEPVELGDSDAVLVGERAISIGNPLGLDHTLTTGVVSARRKYEGRKWIQMSTPISPGNSGGPVFNGLGAVIGVTTAQIRGGLFGGGAQNLNLAVPINELKARLKPSYPGRRKLGSVPGSSTW